MTFARQMGHFVRFDLLRTTWWWVAYAALLLTVSLVYFGQPLYAATPDFTRWLLPPLTWLVAMGLAVTVVQGDAPLSPTAFWQGKPVSGQALGAAKLLMLSVVALGAILTAIATWHAVGMPADTVPATLRRVVPLYLSLVLICALFGAVTRSLGTAFLLLVGLVVAIVLLVPVAVLSFGVSGFSLELDLGPWQSLGSLAIVAVVCVLWFMYRVHTRRGVRPAVVTAGAVLLGAATLMIQLFVLVSEVTQSVSALDRRNTVRVVPDAPASMTETVRFDSVSNVQRLGRSVAYTVVGARPDRRYELQAVRLTPFDQRGIGGRLETMSTTPMIAPVAAFEADSAFRWVARMPAAPTAFVDRGFVFGGVRIAGIDSIRSVELEATVVRFRAEYVRTVPFAPGAIETDGDIMLRLRALGDNRFALIWSTFDAERNEDRDALVTGSSPLYRAFAFVVVDSATRTRTLLGSSMHRTSTEWLVMPGAWRTVHEDVLDAQPALRRLAAPSRPAAALEVYRWVEDGRRRVRQTLPVNDWPPAPNNVRVLLTESR